MVEWVLEREADMNEYVRCQECGAKMGGDGRCRECCLTDALENHRIRARKRFELVVAMAGIHHYHVHGVGGEVLTLLASKEYIIQAADAILNEMYGEVKESRDA